MSAVIDERVTKMEFDNKDFEQNVQQSMTTLQKFNNALNNLKAGDALDQVASSSKKAAAGLGDVVESVQVVASKFNFANQFMIGLTKNLSDEVYGLGVKFRGLVKSLSIDQVSAGFSKYADITQSVQTILAATREQGETIESVTAQVDKLLWFTDETSYNLVDMTHNISAFTSKGIALSDAVTQMQGIATAAALAGANATDASHAMEGFSKAMGAQYMNRQNWSWIRTAHMDTVQTKQAFIDAAVELGTLKKAGEGVYQTVKGNTVTISNFEEAMKDAWMTTDVMQKALSTFGGFTEELYKGVEKTGLTTTELLDALEEYKSGVIDISKYTDGTTEAAETLSEVLSTLNDSSLDLGNKSFRAAQEAKTFQEAIDSVKDAVSSGWMKTFDIIFGNYEEAKKLWTGVANAMYEVFAEGGNARNEILGIWKELGGRKELITGVVEAFNALLKPLMAAKAGFSSIFPDIQGMGDLLYKLTVKFREFTESIQPSEEVLFTIHSAFKALGAVAKTLVKSIGAVFKAFSPLMGPLSTALGYVLKFIQYISALIIVISNWLQQHEKVMAALVIGFVAFKKWRSAINLVTTALGILKGVGLFGVTTAVKGLTAALVVLKVVGIVGLIAAIGTLVGVAIFKLIKNFDKLKNVAGGVKDAIVTKFKGLSDKLKEATGFDLFDSLSKKFNTFSSKFSTFKDKLISGVTSGVSKFKESLGQKGIVGAIKDMALSVKDKGLNAISTFGESFVKLAKSIPPRLKNVGFAIPNFLQKFNGFSKISDMLSPLKDGFVGNITKIIDNIKAFMASGNKLEFILNNIKSIGSTVATTFQNIGGKVGSVAVSFGTKAFEGVSKFIRAFKDALKTTGLVRKGVSAHELDMSEGLETVGSNMESASEKATGLSGVFETLQNALSKVPEGVKKVIDVISKLTNGFDPGTIAALAFLGVMISFSFALKKFMGTATEVAQSVNTNIIQGIGGVLGGVKNTLGNFNNMFQNLPLFKQPEKVKMSFKEFAESIAIIAGALGVLAFIPTEQLVPATKSLLGLIAAFTAMSVILMGLSALIQKKGLNPAGFTVTIGAMIGMAGSILMMVGALLLLEKVDISDFGALAIRIALLGGITLMMVGVATALARLPKTEKLTVKMIGLTLFAFACTRMINALKELNGLSLGLEALVGLAAIVGAMALLSLTVGQVKLSSALGFFLVVKTFEKLAPEFKTFAQTCKDMFTSINWEDLKSNVDKNGLAIAAIAALIALVAGMLAVLLFAAADAFGKVVGGVIAVSIAVAILLKVMNSWKTMDWAGAVQAVAGVLAIMGGFSAILLAASNLKIDKKTQKMGMHIGATALALSVAFGILVGLMEIIGLMNTKAFVQAIVAVDSVMALYALMIFSASKLKDVDKKALTSLVAGIIALLVSLIVLSIIDPKRLIMPTIAIVGVMAALAKVLNEASKIKGNKKVLFSLLPICLMLGELGTALYFLADKNWKQLAAAGLAMGVAMISLTKVIKEVSSGSGLGSERTYKGKFVTLLGISIMIGALGLSMAVLARHPWAQIAAAGFAMGLALSAIVGVLESFSKMKTGSWSDIAKKMVQLGGLLAAMVAISFILPLLAKGFSSFANVGWESIGKGFVGLAAAMGPIIIAGKIIGKDANTIIGMAAGIVALYAVSILLADLAKGLILMSAVPWAGIGKACVGLLATVGIMTGLGALMGAFLPSIGGLAAAAVDLYAVSIILPVFAAGLMAMSMVPWDGIGKAAVALVATVGVMAGLGALMGVFVPAILGLAAAVVGLYAVAIVLPILAAGLIAMAAVPWEGLGKATATLGALLGILVAFGALMAIIPAIGTGFIIAAAGLAVMAISLTLITPSLVILSALDLMTLASGLMSMAGAFAVLGLSGALLAIPAVTLPILSIGLLLFSGAAAMASVAVTGLATAFTAAATMVVRAVQLLIYGIQSGIQNAVTGAGNVVKSVVTTLISGTQKAQPMVAKAGEALIASGSLLEGMLSGVPSLTKGGSGIVVSLVKSITGTVDANSGLVEAKGGEMGQSFLNGLLTKLKDGLGTIGAKINEVFGLNFDFSRIGDTINKVGDVIKDPMGALGDTIEEWTGFNPEDFNLDDFIGDLTEQFGLGEEGAFDWSDAVGGAGGAAEKTEKKITRLDLITMAFAKSYEKTLKEFSDTDPIEIAGDAIETLKKKYEEAGTSIDDVYSSLRDTISGQIDIFAEFNKKTDMTADKLISNMRSQVEGVRDWANKMQTLGAKGVDEGLLQKLADLGPNGYEYVNAFVNMTEDQLKEANALYAESLVLPDTATAQVMAGFAYAAEQSTAGFTKYMRSEGASEMENSTFVAGQKAIDGLNEGTGVHSPSTKTRETAANVTYGFLNYMNTLGVRLWELCMHEVGRRAIVALNEVMTYDTGYGVGKNFAKGLANGIKENGQEAINNAKAIADAVSEASAKALQEKSPSRVAYSQGRFWDMGLANGIIQNEGLVSTASENVAHSTISTFASMADDINTTLEGINPVITPILDSSNLMAQAQGISSMFDAAKLNYSQSIQNDWSNPSVRDRFMSELVDAVGSDKIVDAINSKDNSTNVYLEGDAAGVFKIVRRENRSFIKRTGYNGLA